MYQIAMLNLELHRLQQEQPAQHQLVRLAHHLGIRHSEIVVQAVVILVHQKRVLVSYIVQQKQQE